MKAKRLFYFLRYAVIVKRRRSLRAWIDDDGTLVLMIDRKENH